jgi:hypothetical protein
MRGWGGESADRHARFVFTDEPVDRLALRPPPTHARGRIRATARVAESFRVRAARKEARSGNEKQDHAGKRRVSG